MECGACPVYCRIDINLEVNSQSRNDKVVCFDHSSNSMSSSSLYFIHTIIGGLVQKIPNIGTCGRPASRFKEIGSIYSPEVENSIKMPLVLGGRVTRSSYRKLDFDDAGFTDEVVSGHAENQVDNKSNNDSEQHSNCEITLKEFKDRCKAKKRKASKSIDCTEKDIDFSRKCGPAYVQIKEEDSELEETLSSWKQKLSKKPKIKRKHPGKQSAGLVKDEAKSSSLSDVAQDLILDGSLQTGESCTLNKIKSEVIEMDSYDQQNVVCVDDYSAPACSVKVNPSDNSSTKLLDTVGGGDVLTRNPFSYIKKVDSMDSAAKLSERVGIELDRGESTFFKHKSQDCCISEVSTQYLEPGERININGATPKMDSLETTSQGSNSSHTSELKMENALTHLLSSGCAGSLSLPKDLDSEVHGHCHNHSYPKEKHYNTDTEMLDLAIVNLWCTELDNGRHIFDLKSEGLEIVDKVPVEHEKSTESSGEDASDPSTGCVSHSSLQEILCQVGGNSVTQMCDRDTDFGIQSMGLYNESDAWAADLESKGPGVSVEVPIEREMPDKENAVPDVTNEDSVPYHENRTENIDALNTSSKNYDLCFSVANNFHSCNGSLPTSDNAVAQVCDMDTDQITQSMGLYKESDTCASDLDSKGLRLPFEMSRNREMPDKENTVPDASEEDAVPRHENMPERIDVLYTSSQNSDLCFSVANNSHSCNGSLSKSEKVLSSPTALETEPATIEEAKDSYAKVIVSSPTSELMETDVCSLKPTRPPEKLLSTRKVCILF